MSVATASWLAHAKEGSAGSDGEAWGVGAGWGVVVAGATTSGAGSSPEQATRTRSSSAAARTSLTEEMLATRGTERHTGSGSGERPWHSLHDMDITVLGSLVITYAVVQTIVFLLLIRFLDLYEREPISVLALMALWGAVGATSLSAAGNVAVQRLLPERIDVLFGTAIYAPVVEELAKGAALVAFVALSLWARGRFGVPHFEGVTDGIVYGAAVGLGFAFTEDVLYLLLGASERGLEAGFVTYLARRDFFGLGMLHHAIFTGAFGVGLGLATWTRRRGAAVFFSAAGLLLGMLLHALNNGAAQLVLYFRYGLDDAVAYAENQVVGTLYERMAATAGDVASFMRFFDYVLVSLFALAIVLWLRHQRRVIHEELREETENGLISRAEWELLPSYWKRTMWYWQLVKTGQWERWKLLRRIHNELVDFAFLKRRSGDGDEDREAVERERALISKLKAQKVVFL